MTETLILRTLILANEDGHFKSFALHSQREEIADFIIADPLHHDRVDYRHLMLDRKVHTKEDLLTVINDLDYEEFLEFLQRDILARGVAELSDVRYTPTNEDPF